MHNQAQGSCAHGNFLPFHSMLLFNSYFSLSGQDKCLPCPAGFHCSKGLQRRCPPGFYCPQKTGISFYPCPPGTYNPSYGLSHAERCQQCPAGEGMLSWDMSKRVMISLQLSLTRSSDAFWPPGNANIKIHSQRRILVPLVVSSQGFGGCAEGFGSRSGFPRGDELD